MVENNLPEENVTRRNALKYIGAGVAGLAVGSLATWGLAPPTTVTVPTTVTETLTQTLTQIATSTAAPLEEFGPGIDYYYDPKLKGTQINYLAAALPEKPPVFKYIPLFEQETGMKVNLTVLSETDVFTKASTVFASKSPEFDVVDAGWYGAAAYAYWKSGFVTPIQDFFDKTPKGFKSDDFLDAPTKACTSFPEDGSKLLAMPICSTVCMGLWHNYDLLKNSGLSMPMAGECTLEGDYVKGTPPTWDEFKAGLNKIQNPPKVIGFGNFMLPPVLSFYGWEPFVWSYNTNFFHKDYTPNFTDPDVIEATKLFLDMTKYVADPSTYDWGTMMAEATAGQLASFFTCATDQPDIFAKGSKVTPEIMRLGFAPRAKTSAIYGAGSTPTISAFSQKQDAAWAFYSWIQSPRMQQLFLNDGNSPTRKSIVANPANKSMKDWFIQNNLQTDKWLADAKPVGTPGADLVYCFIAPKMPRSIDMTVAIGTEIGKLYSKEETAEEAMANCQSAAEKILKDVGFYGTKTYEFGV
jgi:multiple sugar transport system substrate-binding protein